MAIRMQSGIALAIDLNQGANTKSDFILIDGENMNILT
jgi:hypothetical protein